MSYKPAKKMKEDRRTKRRIVLLCLAVLLLFQGCALNKIKTTAVMEQFFLTAEHVPGRQGAVIITEVPKKEENLPVSKDNDTPPTIAPTATPTPTVTPVPTATPTVTPTVTPTPTISPTPIIGTYEKNGDYTELPVFTGTSYVVVDYKTGEIVLAKDSGKRIYPASTIKMLTALTALDYKDMADPLTSKADVLDAIPFDATSYGAVAGMTFPMEVWMNMLMISSYADAANTIADGVAGSVETFVTYMNKKAESLGLSATHVDNPIGLDIGNGYTRMYSTAEDIAKLARAYMKNAVLASIVQKAEYTVPDCDVLPGKKIESTNFFLTKSDIYHSEYFTVIGTKSGMTDAAGSCQVITAKNDAGKKYVCCYFGGTTKSVIFDEITAILEYCYLNF